MALEWLSNAFQRFIGFFTGNQENQFPSPNEAHPQAAGAVGSFSPEEIQAASNELFDNQFRRDAKKHADLRADCFKKADEARNRGDHASANDFVNQVRCEEGMWCMYIRYCGIVRLYLFNIIPFTI